MENVRLDSSSRRLGSFDFASPGPSSSCMAFHGTNQITCRGTVGYAQTELTASWTELWLVVDVIVEFASPEDVVYAAIALTRVSTCDDWSTWPLLRRTRSNFADASVYQFCIRMLSPVPMIDTSRSLPFLPSHIWFSVTPPVIDNESVLAVLASELVIVS